MIADSRGIRPDRPFFTYLAFGATHAPHQAPPDYLAKYRGRFDDGWDVVRRRWYERQLAAGIIPPGTELAPRNPGVEAWDDLPENQRRLACRLQEAFAAFLDHTDTQIGRLVDGLRSMELLDDTILVVLADNGASQEGGPFGVMHEMKFFNGIFEVPDQAIARIDDIGGPHSHTNYPWGWAQCGNTPFKWYKQNTHEGGVHVPMIVHWPAGIDPAQRGTTRHAVRQRRRHRPDRVRPARDRTPHDLPRCRATARHRALVRERCSNDAGRPGHQPTPVLRDGGQPRARRRARRRRVEGGVPPPPRRRLRHRAVGALPPRHRLVGVPRPRRRAARRGSTS